jgi:cyclopropane-fatty-acyl-phospholipid synthase
MIRVRAPRLSAVRAAAVLRRVFGRLGVPLAFRLWDGTSVTLGPSEPVCTVVVPAAATFVRLLRDPRPLTFAEAYVEGAIDIEGDLYAAMKVADRVETLRLSAAERVRILAALWRG